VSPSDDPVQLIARCRAGDRHAQEAVARRVCDRALAVAMMATGDPDVARDISQETAIRAMSGLSRLRDDQAFDGWVYRIAVAEVRRSHRRRLRHTYTPLESVELSELPVELADVLDRRQWLWKALAELPARQRIAIALRYAAGMTDRQIAAAMGCRAGTARSLLSRAIARLREAADGDECVPMSVPALGGEA
jgi:RNA polymerase sigma factor (sigma-70 family)